MAQPPNNPGQPAEGVSPADFGMTDLEEALRGPNGPAVAKDLINRLNALDDSLKSKMAAGVTPEEFTKLGVIRNSFAAARESPVRPARRATG